MSSRLFCTACSRMAATLAFFSTPSTTLPTSLLIWRSRPLEIGADLAHARVRRQQRRRQLRELPLQTNALLHEILNERRLLHVGQRLGVAGPHHLAHGFGARLRLVARGLRLAQLRRELAQLLLVEPGIVGPALEDVGLPAEALDVGLRFAETSFIKFVDLAAAAPFAPRRCRRRCASRPRCGSTPRCG